MALFHQINSLTIFYPIPGLLCILHCGSSIAFVKKEFEDPYTQHASVNPSVWLSIIRSDEDLIRQN